MRYLSLPATWLPGWAVIVTLIGRRSCAGLSNLKNVAGLWSHAGQQPEIACFQRGGVIRPALYVPGALTRPIAVGQYTFVGDGSRSATNVYWPTAIGLEKAPG